MSHEKSYERDKVIKIINSVIQRVEKDKDVSYDTILQQLEDLNAVIKETRAEIHQIGPSDIASKDIPSATDELDAVIDATAGATGTIMDSCEAMESFLPSLPETEQTKLQDEITKIYEACSFQDITGQRITKVVRTLNLIEEKVQAILQAMGSTESSGREETSSETDYLLNGPQLPENAINQEEIDRMLAEFDD